jgi:excisionase family DNA binding protein
MNALLNLKQAAEIAAVSQATLRRLIKRGKIPFVKDNYQYFIPRQAIAPMQNHDPTATDTEPLFYGLTTTAALLQMSKKQVYRLVKQRKLEAIRIGNLYRVPASAIQRFLDQAKVSNDPKSNALRKRAQSLYIRLSPKFPNEPKTLLLESELGAPGFKSLIALWCYASTRYPSGHLPKDPALIAKAAHWDNEPISFVNCLIQVGFLQDIGDSYYLVDWEKHRPKP